MSKLEIRKQPSKLQPKGHYFHIQTKMASYLYFIKDGSGDVHEITTAAPGELYFSETYGVLVTPDQYEQMDHDTLDAILAVDAETTSLDRRFA